MKRILIAGAIVAVGLGLSAASAAPSQWKVTGGGQIFADTAATTNGGGPGATLAFTAQGTGGPARGQLQYNDHDGVKFHAQVDCLIVTSEDVDEEAGTPDVKVGRIGGTYQGDDDAALENFQLYIEDHDNGGPQNGTELLTFRPDSDSSSCDPDDEEVASQLGRGNIVIHKEKAPKS